MRAQVDENACVLVYDLITKERIFEEKNANRWGHAVMPPTTQRLACLLGPRVGLSAK